MKVGTDGRGVLISAHYDLHVQKQNAGQEDSTKPLFRYVRKQGPHQNLNLEAFTTHQLYGQKLKGRRTMEGSSLLLVNRFMSAVPSQPRTAWMYRLCSGSKQLDFCCPVHTAVCTWEGSGPR